MIHYLQAPCVFIYFYIITILVKIFSYLGDAMENARSQIIKIIAGDEQGFISGVLEAQ